MTAVEQLNRIVSLVAELSRREREGDAPATLSQLADQHGVSVGQIQRDISRSGHPASVMQIEELKALGSEYARIIDRLGNLPGGSTTA